MNRKSLNAVTLGLFWLASLGAVFILGILSAFAFHLGPGATDGAGDLTMAQREAMLAIERYSGRPTDISAIMAVGAGLPSQLEQATRAIVRDTDPDQRERAAIQVVSGLPSRQLMAVIKLLQEIPPNPGRDQVLGVCLEFWAAEDGRRAIVFATSLNAPAERELAIQAVLRGWSRGRPEEAWNWVLEQTGVSRRAERWLAIVVSGLGSVDRYTSFSLLEQMPESAFRDQMAQLVMQQLLNNVPPRQAIDWLGEFPESSALAAASVLAGEWAQTEPEAATEWLHRSYPRQTRALAGALAEWVYLNPDNAMEWVWRTYAGEERRDLLDGAAEEWIANDGPAPLANWLNAHGPDRTLDGAISQVALHTADFDPATAMVWAQSIVEQDTRSMMEIVIGRRWIQLSPEDAAVRLPQYVSSESARAALLQLEPPADVVEAVPVIEPEPPLQ